jgi:sporulation protein YqfC
MHVVKRGDKIRLQMAEKLEMPKDVILDIPKVMITGNIQVNIENHRGIIEYNSNVIRVNSNVGVLTVTGVNLDIKNIVTDEIIITGDIENIDISG